MTPCIHSCRGNTYAGSGSHWTQLQEHLQSSLGTLSHPTSTAVFPILADVVKVKKGSRSTAHWSIDFIRLNGWLRRCFTLLITPLDIDQNWEDNNKRDQHTGSDQGGQTGSQRRSYFHECHTNIATWLFADGRPARMPKHEPVLSTGIICQIG